jgi:ATP-dependent helicase IRC3
VTFTLRPYQDEALVRVAAAEARGVRSLLGVAATGLGKTIMFVSLVQRRGGRALILAHRDELIGQAVAKVAEAEPELPVTLAAHDALVEADRADLLEHRMVADTPESIGIVRAKADDVGAGIVVASVQTVSRETRLTRLAAHPFHTVVVDEAHHTLADSYLRVLTGLSAGEPGGPLLFGVTATPERGDSKGLGSVFEEVAFNYDILWGIRSGYLSDLRARRIVLSGFDSKKLKVGTGPNGRDYTAGSAGDALTEANAPVHIVSAWLAEAKGRKTLAFTPTVQTAKDVAEQFKKAGVKAEWVSGETPHDERKAMLRRFHDGDTTVMVNCQVLTEGYDEPSIECVVVARPTRSQGFYVQMVGRGTRRWPGKDECLVLDVVGASDDHSLVTIPTLFGLDDGKLREGTKTLMQAVEDHEAELVAAGQLAARDAELFKRVSTSPIAWVGTTDVRSGNPAYMRTLGTVTDPAGQVVQLPTVMLIQRERGHDRWVAGLVWKDGKKKVLIDQQPLETTMAVGEDFIRKAPVNPRLTDRQAAWRSRPPSEALLAACAKWRMPVPPGCNAGELSALLDAHVARKEAVKAAKRRAERKVAGR